MVSGPGAEHHWGARSLARLHAVQDEFFVHEVFSEVCHAVAHMHTFNPPYAHRDIKVRGTPGGGAGVPSPLSSTWRGQSLRARLQAENVLKTAKGKWVLCDFGSSTTKAQVGQAHLPERRVFLGAAATGSAGRTENMRATTQPAGGARREAAGCVPRGVCRCLRRRPRLPWRRR